MKVTSMTEDTMPSSKTGQPVFVYALGAEKLKCVFLFPQNVKKYAAMNG